MNSVIDRIVFLFYTEIIDGIDVWVNTLEVFDASLSLICPPGEGGREEEVVRGRRQCPQIGRQYRIKNKATIAQQHS